MHCELLEAREIMRRQELVDVIERGQHAPRQRLV